MWIIGIILGALVYFCIISKSLQKDLELLDDDKLPSGIVERGKIPQNENPRLHLFKDLNNG